MRHLASLLPLPIAGHLLPPCCCLLLYHAHASRGQPQAVLDGQLFRATEVGDASAIERLIAEGAIPDTALMWAAGTGRAGAVVARHPGNALAAASITASASARPPMA